MIGKLKGIIDDVSRDHVILDVNGVGYLVYVTSKTIQNLPKDGEKISLLINMQIREDDISMYGFVNEAEKTWFSKLISVKGIGPRLALVILSSMSPEQLLNAILAQDKQAFSKISGVGKKIAERIVTELKDTKAMEGIATPGNVSSITGLVNSNLDDAISALVNLGYQRVDAYNICTKIMGDNKDATTGDLIKLSLKEFAK